MKLKERFKRIENKMIQKAIENFSCCHWPKEKLTKDEVEELLRLIDEKFPEK